MGTAEIEGCFYTQTVSNICKVARAVLRVHRKRRSKAMLSPCFGGS
jgi:hypothetical protein